MSIHFRRSYSGNIYSRRADARIATEEVHAFFADREPPVQRILHDAEAQLSAKETLALAARLGRGLPGRPVIRDVPHADGIGVYIDFRLQRRHPQYPRSMQELLVAKFMFERNHHLALDTLRIPEDNRQRGWGKIFTRNLVDEAVANAVTHIHFRTEKDGSYFWLKCGAQPTDRFTPKDYLLGDAPKEVVERFKSCMKDGNYWGVADLKDGNKNWGRLVTYDTEWSGCIDLSNAVTMKRLQSYTGPKAPIRPQTSPRLIHAEANIH